jgi:hypothetical protein
MSEALDVKALGINVNDSGGEMSMGVDETNKCAPPAPLSNAPLPQQPTQHRVYGSSALCWVQCSVVHSAGSRGGSFSGFRIPQVDLTGYRPHGWSNVTVHYSARQLHTPKGLKAAVFLMIHPRDGLCGAGCVRHWVWHR